jgi:hypothetical protein
VAIPITIQGDTALVAHNGGEQCSKMMLSRSTGRFVGFCLARIPDLERKSRSDQMLLFSNRCNRGGKKLTF